ncbi:uncharacterized protein C6orf62 homolog isoform X2 [Xenia sp. Carnegie-2017]|uniref:uncharacterized protein C6orf62 homolog isoform X2 n=1 Tax=Xenia sp. Carnegie-2017 TaxID=2897299 RepID=UPI001F033478|nr:uncharacterized protein C6orf62 homolog isoform X2 [Xenia sp. Carnegie-2017]
MASPQERKTITMNRLKKKLNESKQSLADEFDFKWYIAFSFKDKRKKTALFEAKQVVSVMTNTFETYIVKGAQDNMYSFDSSQELLDKDMVQLHASQYCPLRSDMPGCVRDIDFILWPRNDLAGMKCFLFSRWKGDAKYRHVDVKFECDAIDYEKQVFQLLGKKRVKDAVVNNPQENIFLFLDQQNWKDHLTRWSVQTENQVLQEHTPE